MTNLLNKKKLATTTGANEKAVHFETPAAAVKEKLPPPPPSEKIQLKNAKMVENLIVPSAKPDTPIQGAKPEKPPQEEPKYELELILLEILSISSTSSFCSRRTGGSRAERPKRRFSHP